MALPKNVVAALAEHLENAELHATDVTKITDDHPGMDWADAYAIQDEIRRPTVGVGNHLQGICHIGRYRSSIRPLNRLSAPA